MNLNLHKLKPKPDNSVMLAEIEAVARQMADCYDSASPKAKANMVSFGAALSKQRLRLLAQSSMADRTPAAACEGLTEFEWRRLVAWMRDPKREPSHLAFTAGHARDAASAFEAART